MVDPRTPDAERGFPAQSWISRAARSSASATMSMATIWPAMTVMRKAERGLSWGAQTAPQRPSMSGASGVQKRLHDLSSAAPDPALLRPIRAHRGPDAARGSRAKSRRAFALS
ncbi:MAG: hypothetical protein K0R38_4465 [Polyangiaceae bacterium]|nr:hypothetical protein [Polyangiaceae bacterium]